MAVGAHDIALCDFLGDGFPTQMLANQVADVVTLVSGLAMVEVQYGEIANATVHAH